MPTVTILDVPEQIHAALIRRASQHGLSLEAEARRILTEALEMDPRKTNPMPFGGLQQIVDRMYAGKKPHHVVEQLIDERRMEALKE